MRCNYCGKKAKEFHFMRGDKGYCSPICLEKHYLREIDRLNDSLKKWKTAWFDLRDIIGWYGYKYCIPDSYKRDNEKDSR